MMPDEGVMRFSMHLFPANHLEDDPWKFFTFNDTDLDNSDDYTVRPWPAVFDDDKGGMKYLFPWYTAHCSIGSSLFLVGGFNDEEGISSYSNLLWSFNPAVSPGVATWSICAKMHCGRSSALTVVPYDGKVIIFGGTISSHDSWVEIHDPQPGHSSPS